jgi:hypothetical protein
LSFPLTLAFLALQSGPDRWIESLGSDRIEERGEAARQLQRPWKDLDEAAQWWVLAWAAGTPDLLVRLDRIRDAWVTELGRPRLRRDGPMALGLPLPRSSNEEDERISLNLKSVRVTMTASRVSLKVLAGAVRDLAKLPVLVCSVDAAEQMLFDLEADDAPLEEFLREQLLTHDLTFFIRHGSLLIAPYENLEWKLEMRVYPVSDLLSTRSPRELGWDILFRMNPGDWNRREGRSLRCLDGVLWARNYPAILEDLEDILVRLRRQPTAVVARDPRKSVRQLFEGLWGKDAASSELQISALGREMAITLRRLVAAELATDLDLRLQAMELGNAAIRGLSRGVLRQVLDSTER